MYKNHCNHNEANFTNTTQKITEKKTQLEKNQQRYKKGYTLKTLFSKFNKNHIFHKTHLFSYENEQNPYHSFQNKVPLFYTFKEREKKLASTKTEEKGTECNKVNTEPILLKVFFFLDIQMRTTLQESNSFWFFFFFFVQLVSFTARLLYRKI